MQQIKAIASEFGLQTYQIANLEWTWTCNPCLGTSRYDNFYEFLATWAKRDATKRALVGRPTVALAHLLASAEAISAAVDALPVGKDIRQRLQNRVAEHVSAVHAIAAAFK